LPGLRISIGAQAGSSTSTSGQSRPQAHAINARFHVTPPQVPGIGTTHRRSGITDAASVELTPETDPGSMQADKRQAQRDPSVTRRSANADRRSLAQVAGAGRGGLGRRRGRHVSAARDFVTHSERADVRRASVRTSCYREAERNRCAALAALIKRAGPQPSPLARALPTQQTRPAAPCLPDKPPRAGTAKKGSDADAARRCRLANSPIHALAMYDPSIHLTLDFVNLKVTSNRDL
jgi:hypothetical protein